MDLDFLTYERQYGIVTCLKCPQCTIYIKIGMYMAIYTPALTHIHNLMWYSPAPYRHQSSLLLEHVCIQPPGVCTDNMFWTSMEKSSMLLFSGHLIEIPSLFLSLHDRNLTF